MSTFSVSPALEAALAHKNAAEVRSAIINYINTDPDNRAGAAAAAIRYAAARGIDLWEAHDASVPMDMDQTHWNTSYAAAVTTDLSFNFSKERFAHWEQVATAVGKTLRDAKSASSATSAAASSHTPSHQPAGGGDSEELAKKIVMGVAVTAAVVVTVAVVITLLK